NFPSRADLLAAAYAKQADTCAMVLRHAVADPDPARGLGTYLRATFVAQAAHPRFVSGYRSVAVSPERLETFGSDLGALVGRARAAGSVRPDLTVADVVLMLAANTGVTASRGIDRVAASRRLAELVLAGVSTPAVHSGHQGSGLSR